ncbi:rhodanese-like domain-containing protein [Bacillus sp. T3]|uniref:rhodanese-like domain-containing protein n=1 Tax=Bacillus sp. T3 TaxID=467262 RepID=UPI002981E0FC|nr:rhodanese-like domain-containing protein [Bacillus sp. T3]
MKEFTTKEIELFLKEGKRLNLIDVREVDEVATGMIPGAVNIPLSLIADQLNELDQSKEYILVCRSGARSGRATQFLESQGYYVSNMKGGMLAWTGKVV